MRDCLDFEIAKGRRLIEINILSSFKSRLRVATRHTGIHRRHHNNFTNTLLLFLLT